MLLQSGCIILHSYQQIYQRNFWLLHMFVFGIDSLFGFSHFHACELLAHYDFTVYFPDD